MRRVGNRAATRSDSLLAGQPRGSGSGNRRLENDRSLVEKGRIKITSEGLAPRLEKKQRCGIKSLSRRAEKIHSRSSTLLLTITASLAHNCLVGGRLRETRQRAPVGRRGQQKTEPSGDLKMLRWSLVEKERREES